VVEGARRADERGRREGEGGLIELRLRRLGLASSLFAVAACARARDGGRAPAVEAAVARADAAPPDAPRDAASPPIDAGSSMRPPTDHPPLEKHALRAFGTTDAACNAVYAHYAREKGSTGPGVACAPFDVRHTCRLVRDARGAGALLEVRVTEIVPTEHCANYRGAPRAPLKNTVLAPATIDGKGVRVGADSMVYGRAASGMAVGLVDGEAELVTKATFEPDAVEALVFREQRDPCSVILIVCDRARTWCTAPVAIVEDGDIADTSVRHDRRCDDEAPRFRLEEKDGAVVVTVSENGVEERQRYPLPPP
jgi:hypothetical protein